MSVDIPIADAPESVQRAARWASFPGRRVRYFPSADASVVRCLGCGIFVVHAVWSGPSHQALGRLSEALNRVDPAQRLEFAIAGIDESPKVYDLPELRPIGGAGETVWVCRGQVVRASRLGENAEPFTRELLALWPPYPAPPSWPADVIRLAEALYHGADVAFALADALLEAGHPELAKHFRGESWHPKGCWVLDAITRRK